MGNEDEIEDDVSEYESCSGDEHENAGDLDEGSDEDEAEEPPPKQCKASKVKGGVQSQSWVSFTLDIELLS